jgi:hypothetical protein
MDTVNVARRSIENPKSEQGERSAERRREPVNDKAAPTADVWTYRLVVIFLGVATLLAMGGAIGISLHTDGKNIPEILIALGSASVGALAGLLAPSPSTK